MIVRARVLLIIFGVAAFMLALRTQNEIARWVGIVCVAASLGLRFVKRDSAARDREGSN